MAQAGERPKQLPRLDPGSVFAGYRIDSLLARGGMGVVYRARDIDLDRTVALKIIAPEHTQDETAVARFKSEARMAASLEHPNIVPIHRGGEFEGVLYLAMRLVPGTNLREVIDNAPMALPRVARIITDIAKGTPDYTTMGQALADAVRGAPQGGQRIKDLGPLKSLAYTETGPGGMDIYRATFEKGALIFRIAMQADGKIGGLNMQPAPAQ